MPLHFKYVGAFFLYVFINTATVFPKSDIKPVETKEIKTLPKKMVPNVNTKAPLNVRVLLDEGTTQKEWHLSSPGGFVLWNPDNPQKKIKSRSDDIVIRVTDGQLYLGKQCFTQERVYLKPYHDMSFVNGNGYHGAFLIEQAANRTMFINCLDLEDYVFSVLGTESLPGWPLEVQKVFAIICRSYVISMAIRAKKNKLPYHIKNTNEHQTYSGLHTNALMARAVQDTKGIFLAYKNEPILAMYDVCCGGIIPAHIAGFDFQKAPYLARKYACTYCKGCRAYSWKTELELSAVERKLKQKFCNLTKLTNVTVNKKDKAGLVREVICKDKKRTEKLSGRQMRALFSPIKSFCFEIQKKAHKVIVSGRGFGHHMGLCQWGAREMVRDGWNYRRILSFYYPGIDFKQLV
ncbi:MAG: SpoIID/LytB domain-containing protein [bacterium]|nr:SpoIID/LytB domain-containing protein [bacterium]